MNALSTSTRAYEPHPSDRAVPYSLEMEQALLGVVLYDNEAFHRAEGVTPESFYEPFHGRLWAEVSARVARGDLAEPLGLYKVFEADPAMIELSGQQYLVDLTYNAPPAANAASYAKALIDLALRRNLIRAAEQLAQSARDGECKVDEILSQAERDIHGASASASGAAKFVRSGAAAESVLERLDNPEEPEGVSWGLEPMDKQLGTMQAGDLIVLGGRTSMGKSALASDLALNIAKQGKAVLEINGEMSVEQMTRRHLTSLAFTACGFDAPGYSDIRKRDISPSQRKMLQNAAREFEPIPLSMLKRTGLGMAALRSLVRRERAEWERRGFPLGAIIIDHVGLIKADGGGRSRYEDQTAVSNGMKEFADELGIPVIALAQLSRETEKRDNKRPVLSDLRDSGAWEQDADVVIGIYRDAYYAAREPEPKGSDLAYAEWSARKHSKTIEAIILKAREGECGTVELWGDMRTNAIRASEPNQGGFF